MFYEYKCPKCNFKFDVQHGMNESPEIPCPKCLEFCKRIITGGAGVIWKCDGSYSKGSKNTAEKLLPEGESI